MREAEQRRRWYAAVTQTRERQIEQHRATVLTEQIRAWRQADEIRAFCQAARARTGETPVTASEADWLDWAEAYAMQLDPLRGTLTDRFRMSLAAGLVLGDLGRQCVRDAC
ncbi:hypothetical protein ACRWOO_10315 [Streptomyces sp. NEAU-PBA10]|uniref:hypothetical protein n=1 Tax=Streptomyces sp. NEAU-PBA10 TaxID=3438640 RepID=UPI003F7A32FA